MITRNAVPLQTENWQKRQAEAVRDPAELLELLGLPRQLLPAAKQAAREFGLRVPREYLSRITPGDIHDPLLRQVLPLAEELYAQPGFGTDPVGDAAARAGAGILHKYHGRVLLITTGACGIHCRYCFRRHYPYQQDSLLGQQWQQTLSYLESNTDVEEVILSGGDPLSLSDDRLSRIISDLDAIPHLKRLRIHSRQPIVLPQRVTSALLARFEQIRMQAIMVVHVNHAREIDVEVSTALRHLNQAGCVLLNQSVLLAGVNDTVESLVDLSRRLFETGVMPYYLHQLDRVAGAAHFEVEDQHARSLMEGVRAQLPGYLVPRLVREHSGAANKLPLD
ncbi:MAG: EF-P beta-lysylation protein EpmB [Gammaproteobacteria bacterium]|nr:EF-P beta-lysylation protein EpmB [Gammaproteobacteria bacterium]